MTGRGQAFPLYQSPGKLILPTEEVKGQFESYIQMCCSSLATVEWGIKKACSRNWGCMNCVSVSAPECLVSLEQV